MKVKYVNCFSESLHDHCKPTLCQTINIDGEFISFPIRLRDSDTYRERYTTFTGFKRSNEVAFGNESISFFTHDTVPHWDHVTTQAYTYNLEQFKERLKKHKELEN